MSKNIKDISKQLMGESLNAFHRKVGLESIEKNNEMQSKVLQGIYSQVDDNYLEKTEQSNVIHLEGSGDGVVEIESVEGNSLVNIFKNVTGTISLDNIVSSYTNNTLSYKAQSGFEGDIYPAFLGNFIPTYDLVHNKDYVFVFDCNIEGADFGLQGVTRDGQFVNGTTFKTLTKKGRNTIKFTTPNDLSEVVSFKFRLYSSTTNNEHLFSHFKLFEGTNIVEPSSYFKGLQSSFEEKKVDDKYEIEILLNNGNLFDKNNLYNKGYSMNGYTDDRKGYDIKVKPNKTYTITNKGSLHYGFFSGETEIGKANFDSSYLSTKAITTPTNCNILKVGVLAKGNTNDTDLETFKVEYGSGRPYKPHKSNKIKLLVNEPLRGLPNGVKDKLCVKNGKLVVERNCGKDILNGLEDDWVSIYAFSSTNVFRKKFSKAKNEVTTYDVVVDNMIVDNMPIVKYNTYQTRDAQTVSFSSLKNNSYNDTAIYININSSKDLNVLKNTLNEKPLILIYELKEPYYEEVTNEYGEPILLEGYENGTLYIDSVIVPTTSVRYTQKFESRNTLNQVKEEASTNTITSDMKSLVLKILEIEKRIYELELKYEINTDKEKRILDNYNLVFNNLKLDLAINEIEYSSKCFDINNINEVMNSNNKLEMIKLIKDLAIKNKK